MVSSCAKSQFLHKNASISNLVKVFFLHPEHEAVFGDAGRVDHDVRGSFVLVKDLRREEYLQ